MKNNTKGVPQSKQKGRRNAYNDNKKGKKSVRNQRLK